MDCTSWCTLSFMAVRSSSAATAAALGLTSAAAAGKGVIGVGVAILLNRFRCAAGRFDAMSLAVDRKPVLPHFGKGEEVDVKGAAVRRAPPAVFVVDGWWWNLRG